MLDTSLNVGPALPWESVDELSDKRVGWVPHYSLGTTHAEAAEKYDIPFEAMRGGADTTYPEYQLKIQKMRAETQAKKEAAAKAKK